MASSPRFIVVSPQESQGREVVGTYYERWGWTIKDTSNGVVFWSGAQSDARWTARELNARTDL